MKPQQTAREGLLIAVSIILSAIVMLYLYHGHIATYIISTIYMIWGVFGLIKELKRQENRPVFSHILEPVDLVIAVVSLGAYWLFSLIGLWWWVMLIVSPVLAIGIFTLLCFIFGE